MVHVCDFYSIFAEQVVFSCNYGIPLSCDPNFYLILIFIMQSRLFPCVVQGFYISYL